MVDREFNKVNINVEFEETANRQQLSSGDNIKTIFGKIKKWLSDLKPVAFSGSYNDLSDIPSTLDAEKYATKEEINSLKKSVSDGKAIVANAITGQGIITATDTTFATMANNVTSAGDARYNAGVAATKKGTATEAQVLEGYTFTSSSGVELTGTIANKGYLNWKPITSGTYSILAGYYSGGILDSTTVYNNALNNAVLNGEYCICFSSISYYSGNRYLFEEAGFYLELKENYILIFDFKGIEEKFVIDSAYNPTSIYVNNNLSIDNNGESTYEILFTMRNCTGFEFVVSIITWAGSRAELSEASSIEG